MSVPKTALVGDECVACGACAKACPFGAISVYRGLFAQVREDACKGCGICARVCPAGVIRLAARLEAAV